MGVSLPSRGRDVLVHPPVVFDQPRAILGGAGQESPGSLDVLEPSYRISARQPQRAPVSEVNRASPGDAQLEEEHRCFQGSGCQLERSFGMAEPDVRGRGSLQNSDRSRRDSRATHALAAAVESLGDSSRALSNSCRASSVCPRPYARRPSSVMVMLTD